MSIIVIFGLPGVGKTYTSHLFEKYFGYHVYDADTDLPKDMQETLKIQGLVTDEMRDRFFYAIMARTKELTHTHDKIVVSQTFIKEMYRKRFLSAFPYAQFVWLVTSKDTQEKRLINRKEFPISLSYAQTMGDIFEPPQIPHTVFTNDEHGEDELKKQIEKFMQRGWE